jgi:hypothetical protein
MNCFEMMSWRSAVWRVGFSDFTCRLNFVSIRCVTLMEKLVNETYAQVTEYLNGKCWIGRGGQRGFPPLSPDFTQFFFEMHAVRVWGEIAEKSWIRSGLRTVLQCTRRARLAVVKRTRVGVGVATGHPNSKYVLGSQDTWRLLLSASVCNDN